MSVKTIQGAASMLTQQAQKLGSTISIVNDTDDTYFIKVGSDREALRTARGAINIAAGAASVLACCDRRTGLKGPFNVAGRSRGAGDVVGAASGSMCIADGVEMLRKDNYIEVPARTVWTSGVMTLSLWQQCDAFCHKRDDSGRLRQHRVVMRPIFSGATPQSTREYSISEWVNKSQATQ
eukprot:TRINITY_DN42224_c0_g1_i1.p2 TRINITY_DN42224_c0_g1~~TRINITY_DN42224_c0_g1_i1.p2  ORF type:complete len:180 (-),score=8.82 TRINITY_DN42224_c0_g1_i1:128-667(-)